MPQTMPINDDVEAASPKSSRAEDYALQKVQITSFIRHILEQYRFGLQILAEFIQNADDAKAQTIDIGLDERTHRSKAVPGQGTAELMGPALTVYNNETFSEQDFQNITNTGDSGKRKDASKTGRFCLGINTAFHLGDCILLVTGSRMVAFDPTRRFFPEPLLVEFGPNSHQFADQYPDFCLPFLEYGITFREHYPGTLFRIPLRTHAPPGSLSRQIYSPQELWTELLDEFCEQVAPCLLFLRSVQSISVHSIGPDGARKEVCRAEVEAEQSGAFLAERTTLFQQLLARSGPEKLKVAEFHARLRALQEGGPLPAQVHEVHLRTWRSSRLSKKKARQETPSSWLLSTRVAGGEALELAMRDPDALEDRRVPLVQVAACTELGGVQLPKVEGRVHVALPLLDERFHGMHANLFADTSPDRRKLLRSQERHVTAWSHALMQDGCAASAADMLLRLAQRLAPSASPPAVSAGSEEPVGAGAGGESDSSGSDSDGSWEAVGRKGQGAGGGREAEAPMWYGLFPILDETTQDPLTEVLHKRVYAHLRDKPVLLGVGREGGGLCRPSEAVYVEASRVPAHVQAVVGEVLRLSGRHWLVQPTERMVRGFRAAGAPLEVGTPHMVVRALHDPTPELRAYLTASPGAHVAVLGYILRDSKASRQLPGAWVVLSLDGVLRPLPAARNSISLSSDSDNSSEEEGSPAARAAGAGAGEEGELYVASQEQKELVGGAEGPLGRAVLQMGEEVLHRRLLGRLSRCCGVRSVSRCAEAFCKVVPRLLPEHWLGKRAVRLEAELEACRHAAQHDAGPEVPAGGGQAGGVWVSRERVGALWGHLSTYADLSAAHLAGAGPLLPTMCGQLVAVDGVAWFDLADVAFLSEEELQLLIRRGVVLVDCEANAIPRQVRKLKCAANGIVDELSASMRKQGRGAEAAPCKAEGASVEERTDAERVLSMLAKLHGRTKLSAEQLETVRAWLVLEVEGADGGRQLVSLKGSGGLHDCGPAVDHRLLRGGGFLVPGERSKEMQGLLAALGVVWVEEAELYLKFVLPSLGGGGSMLREEAVLADFLAETLPRIEARFASGPLAGFAAALAARPLVPSEDPAAPLLRAVDARDPACAGCRELYPPARFPSAALQERGPAMHMLRRMGLSAAASEADLEALYPAAWAGKEVVDDWAPGERGHPTVAQAHAAWVLCGAAERGLAWAATSAGRLVRGRRCAEMLPRDLPAELPAGFAGRLGLETLLTAGETDFSQAAPPGGFLPVTPSSLLRMLSSGLWARGGGGGLEKLTGEDREFLRGFLTRPLQATGAVAQVAADGAGGPESSALVSVEGRRVAQAKAMRQICELAIHKEVAWSEASGAVEVSYAALAESSRRRRRGGERLRGAEEEEEVQGVEELLDFHVVWVLLRESVWQGQAQLPAGTLGLSARRFVSYEEHSAWFYRECGVQEVARVSELYAELVLRGRGFSSLAPADQQQHILYIRERRLLDGSETGRALAMPLRSVPVQADEEGVLRKASELVDCRVPELATIFASKGGGGKGGPWLLPKAVAKDKCALAFLEQLGLRRGVEDFDFLVTCARALGKIAAAWAKERAGGGEEGARTQRGKGGVSEGQLVEAGLYLFEALGKFKEQESMLAQLGRIPFVPLFLSKRPYSFQPPGGAPLAAVRDLAPPALSNVHCLVRPTLHPDIEAVPKAVQNLLWPQGDLDHDGDTVHTIKQLRRLSELIGHWDNPAPSPELAAKKHLKELEELVFECYSSLDDVAKKKDDVLNNLSLVHDELLKFPCVYMQTLHTFVRADQCFAAVPSSVNGLLFALDSRLQTWPSLIEELRIKDRPSRIQWLAMLKSLMDRPPSPQNADACVELLKIVAKDTELMGTLAFLDELVAPDSSNVLRPVHELLINDAPWLLPRIAPSAGLNIAHRKLGANRQLARTLRLRTLSDAVEETVFKGERGEEEEEGEEVGEEVAAAFLLRDLNGREVQGHGSPLRHRLLWLMDQQLSEPSLLGATEDGGGEEAEGARVSGARVCELLEGIPGRLVQVDKIVSRFELLQAASVPPTAAGEGAERQLEQWRQGLRRRDVTNAATRTDSMLLLAKGEEAVQVARGLLHVPSVLQSKLAGALNKALGGMLNERSERVLSSLLACQSKEEMDACLDQLQLHHAEEGESGEENAEARVDGLLPVPKELLASAGLAVESGAVLSGNAKLVLTKDKPEASAVRVGDLVAVAADLAAAGKPAETLVLAEVVAVYKFLELATVQLGGGVQRVVVLGRDVWWYRDLDGPLGGAPADVSGEKEEGSEDETEELAKDQSEEAGGEEAEAGAPTEAEEEEEEEAANRLDASEKLREIRNEIDSYKGRLEQEKARKMKVYERQVQAEFKDGMKRMLKRLLLKWHPDKLRSQAQEEGVDVDCKNADRMEEYLKDISQELNRIMQQYSQE